MIGNSLLLSDDGGYNLTRSLRFRASATGYLNRTFSTPTSATTFTFSTWMKRGKLGVGQAIIGASVAQFDGLYFNTSDQIVWYVNGITTITTTAVFRDPSAWYHIVLKTSGTSSVLYVNNVQVGSGSVAAVIFNTAISHIIGQNSSSNYFDGYMAEVNFIDGQALTPSSFGAFSIYNQWLPKKYAGTYGTNGFYLPFTNNASAATLGNDFSGNSNTWTTNNISVTAGSTYDSMTDVPTLTSATAANYATLNPIYKSASQPTISNGNLTTTPNTVNYQNAFSTMAITSGKWYCELTVSGTPNSANFVGISNATQLNYLVTTSDLIGAATGVGYAYYIFNGNKYTNGTSTSYGASIASGDVIGIAFDNIAGSLTFYKNGTSQGVAFTGISTTDQFFFGSTVYTGGVSSFSWNFGQRPFAYTPPTGYLALNTFNL